MVADTDRAYISGLFDADGSVSYKKYLCADKRYKDKKGKPKKYWQWKIALEISMTDKSKITDELNGWEVLPKRLRKWAMKIK